MAQPPPPGTSAPAFALHSTPDQTAYSTRVREDFTSGVRSGVNGTPTFFIDGQRSEGSWEEAPLIQALQARLKKPSR